MLLFVGQQSGWLTQTLFESPGTAIAGLAIVWAFMRITGRRADNKKLVRASWVPFVLIAALFAMSSLVTTDREDLAEALDGLLLAVQEDDTPALQSAIDKDATTQFRGAELSRSQVEAMLDRVDFDSVILLDSVVEIDSAGVGMTVIRVRAKGETADIPGIDVSEWTIRWRQADGVWRAVELHCTARGAQAIFGGGN